MERVTMINPVPTTPNMPSPFFSDVDSFVVNLVQQLFGIFTDYANAINSLIAMHNAPFEPVLLPTYVKTALPSAVTYINSMIIVSNETGGLTPAFSDGTNWRRVADRAIVS